MPGLDVLAGALVGGTVGGRGAEVDVGVGGGGYFHSHRA